MQIKYLSWRFSYASIQGRHLSVCIKQVIATLLWSLDHTTSIGNHKAAFALPTVHPNLPNPTFQALSKHLLSYIPNSLTMQLLISSIQFKFISLNKQSIKELYWYIQWSYIQCCYIGTLVFFSSSNIKKHAPAVELNLFFLASLLQYTSIDRCALFMKVKQKKYYFTSGPD